MSDRLRFSDTVRDKRLRLFPKARPCLVLDFEDAVSLYRRHEGLVANDPDFAAQRPIEWKAATRRLRQTRAAARRLRRALAANHPAVRANLPDLSGALAHLDAEAEAWLAGTRRRGPRALEGERLLRDRFLHALGLQGISAGRTRGGRVESAWRIVYAEATGRRLRDDLFRVMSKWPRPVPGARPRSFGLEYRFAIVRSSAPRNWSRFLRQLGT